MTYTEERQRRMEAEDDLRGELRRRRLAEAELVRVGTVISRVCAGAGVDIPRAGRDMHDWLAQVLQVLVLREGAAEQRAEIFLKEIGVVRAKLAAATCHQAYTHHDHEIGIQPHELRPDLRPDPLPAERPPDPELFYIQNRGYCGDCLLWWRVDGHGYTVDLNQAWRVTKEKADSICRSRPQEDFAWPVTEVNSVAELHANSETMRRAGHVC